MVKSSTKASKAPAKKATKKAAVATRKASVKPVVSQKVDYYPNRMTVAVSALAGTVLVLMAVIAVTGSR